MPTRSEEGARIDATEIRASTQSEKSGKRTGFPGHRSDAAALGGKLRSKADAGAGLEALLEDLDRDTHRDLALVRAGLRTETSSDGSGELDPLFPRKSSSDRLDDLLRRAGGHVKTCRRCGGTVEGPAHSTCARVNPAPFFFFLVSRANLPVSSRRCPQPDV